MARNKFVTAPPRLDMQKMQDYPGHQIFKEDGKNTVVAFMGQLYSIAGTKLPHDPKELVRRGFTMTKEMANVFLNKVERETKTCQCGLKIPMSHKFCSSCGFQQPVLEAASNDDMLVKVLQAIDPSNPFALVDTLKEREVSRARPEDFVTKADLERDIQATLGRLGAQIAVPGEAAVAPKPVFSANPFAQVEYSLPG